MKTRQGYEYHIQDGKYIYDGYEFFDSLEEMEEEIDWALEWIDGRAARDNNGEWRRLGGEEKLCGILDDLFGGDALTDEEFAFRQQVLAEQECWLIADKYLTEAEILRIEESWTASRKVA